MSRTGRFFFSGLASTNCSVYQGAKLKLGVLGGHVVKAARRVFGIPDFRFYALADGIKAYLFGQKRGLYGCFSSRDPDTGQRWLFSP